MFTFLSFTLPRENISVLSDSRCPTVAMALVARTVQPTTHDVPANSLCYKLLVVSVLRAHEGVVGLTQGRRTIGIVIVGCCTRLVEVDSETSPGNLHYVVPSFVFDAYRMTFANALDVKSSRIVGPFIGTSLLSADQCTNCSRQSSVPADFFW
jgi:hypothetical protein